MRGLPRRSLRRNLLVWLLVPLFGLGALIAAEAYYHALHLATAVADRTLAGSALSISDRVTIANDGSLEVDLPYVALEMLTSVGDNRVFYLVRARDGALVTGYKDLPLPEAEALPRMPGNPVFYDAEYQGVPVRAAAVIGIASDARRSAGYTVVVAETTQGRQALARETLTRLASRLTALAVIVAAVVWLGISRGLRPLADLGTAVGRRSPDDLRPIDHAAPRETADLVDAINAFIDRLRTAVEGLRQFTGTLGHQMRTPLAIVQSNLALALRSDLPPAARVPLERAERAARDAERLTGQLLLLARMDEARATREGFVAVDMALLAEEVTGERAPAALRLGLELALEVAVAPVLVRGAPVLLREVLLNLIDNAARHAAPGAATVRVSADAAAVRLEVEDHGPGIAPAQRAAALERFARGGAADSRDGGGGTGLGLPICRDIAVLHGGSLTLGDTPGGGLRVTLTLPRAMGEG
ncbi:sensor histidine kinase [Caenispirillum bisanense]|uniref:sensor histidine kinase n=1 Tax=Caenispirillum bisanense TaxID=414052 RepID=UPI0031D734B6